MHTIDIYRGADLFVTIKPDDSSTQVKRIATDNEIRLDFELNHHVDFSINDYAMVFGEKYVVFSLPVLTKESKFKYEYSMIMKAEGYGLSRAQFLFLGSDNSLKQSDFSLMGTAEDFLDLVIMNANRVSSGWTKGQVILSDYKNLTFSMSNCYEALAQIAEAFDTEFFIEGQIVHLTARQRNIPVQFRHGKDRGLYEIKRTSINQTGVVTRLYAFGSERNLPVDYRQPTVQEIIDGGILNPPLRVQSNRLLLPHGEHMIERNVDKYGIIEQTKIFEDIYPHRTGIVTSVNASNFYEFSDATLDFNVNTHTLQGLNAKVTFNTGQLAGYTFDIESYDNATKKFNVLKNKAETAIDVPSDLLKPAIGDQYVLTDINMPSSYLVNAEALLLEAAEKYLQVNSEPQVAYSVLLDPVFFRNRIGSINIGDYVSIKDDEMYIDRKIRVISVNRNIVNEDQLQIELSDIVPTSPFTAVQNAIQSNILTLGQTVRQLQNTFNGRVVLPSTGSTSGFSPVIVDNTTGRLYRQF